MSKQLDSTIQSKIHELRGVKIILDFDIAELYDVPTKVLKQSIRRNKDRFPEDFMFELTENEWLNLRSQIVTSFGEESAIVRLHLQNMAWLCFPDCCAVK